MEIGTALRGTPLGLLWVGLDEPTSSVLDGGQCCADGRPRNTTTPVPASSEDATDPPVGHLTQALGIGFRVFDVRKLHRRPVLAPADAFIAVVNENLVHRSVANVGLLCQTVPRNGMALADALWVETHAPTAAPDPIVSLNQMGKVAPGVRSERPRHIGADRCHPSMLASRNLAMASGPFCRHNAIVAGDGLMMDGKRRPMRDRIEQREARQRPCESNKIHTAPEARRSRLSPCSDRSVIRSLELRLAKSEPTVSVYPAGPRESEAH